MKIIREAEPNVSLYKDTKLLPAIINVVSEPSVDLGTASPSQHVKMSFINLSQ